MTDQTKSRGKTLVLEIELPASPEEVWRIERREALGHRLFGSAGLDVQPAPAPEREITLALGGKREHLSVEFHHPPGHLWGRLPDLGDARATTPGGASPWPGPPGCAIPRPPQHPRGCGPRLR